MFPIQMRVSIECDEELAPIRIPSRVSHAQQARASVLVCKALIVKLQAIDALTPRAVSRCEITTLCHELRDYAMECATLVMQRLPLLPQPLVPSAQCPEILRCLRSVS